MEYDVNKLERPETIARSSYPTAVKALRRTECRRTLQFNDIPTHADASKDSMLAIIEERMHDANFKFPQPGWRPDSARPVNGDASADPAPVGVVAPVAEVGLRADAQATEQATVPETEDPVHSLPTALKPLEDMKRHELMSLCKQRGIPVVNTDKIVGLIGKLNGENTS